jgi:VIT1/CCC1 family predicted Fe2+/Mn2+ transporter
VVILAGGSPAAGARFSEVRTEWEMDRALLEAERASIEADPVGEFEELVGIYEAKGLNPDAELRLEALGPTSGAVLAALTAGLSFGIGAVIPLAATIWLPRGELLALTFIAILFTLGLTGWFAAWLTGLPVIRLVRRNIVLGSAVMAAGILAGLALD